MNRISLINKEHLISIISFINENSDEFLVIKKNPLILPPNFNDLPTPKDVADTTQLENIESEIEDLLSSIKDDGEVSESSSSSDTESFVLEKIKD